MPRQSVIATHPDREGIETALIEGLVTLKDLSARFNVSVAALKRYKAGMKTAIARHETQRDGSLYDKALGRIVRLSDKAEGVIDRIIVAMDSGADPAEVLSHYRDGKLVQSLAKLIDVVGKLQKDQIQVSGESKEVKGGGPAAVLILPPQLPPGAPCHLDRDYWIRRGYTHGIDPAEVQRVLAAPDSDMIQDAEYESVTDSETPGDSTT